MPEYPTKQELETQRQTLRMQEILTSLDATMKRMEQAGSGIGMGARLDEILSKLVDQYGDNKAKVNWEFDKIKSSFMQNQAAEAYNSMMQFTQARAAIQQNIMGVDAGLAAYAPQAYVRPDLNTMFADAAAAGGMRSMTSAFMDTGYSDAMTAGYFGANVTMPYFHKRKLESVIGAPITPMQFALSERQHMNDLASGSDPVSMREFAEYQRTMFEETQKAMFNRHISSSLGVRGGMSARGDFEAVISPAMSGLAEDLGVSIDEAGMVVKKMRDLRIITQDIRSGSGMEILNAVDESARVLQSVSKLIGSSDIQELVMTARQLTSIGGGDFDRGMKITKSNTASILGPFSDPQYSLTEAAAMGQQYASMFGGNNAASVNMGAWDFRTRNMLSQYATGEYFNYAGGPETAAQVYLPHLAARASGIQAYIRQAGGGYDLMSGAAGLSGQAGTDAVSFYSNMPRNLRNAADAQSGVLAEYNLMKEISLYQSQFGMSEQEAMLAVFRGDPSAADAYREVLSAKGAYADETERFVQAGRYSKLFTPRTSYALTDRRVLDYSDPARIAAGRSISSIGQLGLDVTVNPLTSAAETIGNLVPGIRMEGLETYKGLNDLQARRTDTTEDAGFRMKMTSANSDVLMHISRILSTDKGAAATEKVAGRIANMRGAFDFRDIRYILAEGLKDYVYTGQLDERLSAKFTSYIASLTPVRALNEIGPRISSDSVFYKLLEIGVDPSKSTQLLTTNYQFARANLVGAMKESGWSVSDIQNTVLGEDRLLRRGAEFINDNLLASIATSAAGTAGITAAAVALGATPPGLVTAAVGLIAAPAVSAALMGADAAMSYLNVVAGGAVDIEPIVDMIGSGSLSQYESGLNTLLIFTRAIVNPSLWSSSRTYELTATALHAYAEAYGTFISSRTEERKPSANEVLPASMLESAVRVLKDNVGNLGTDTIRTDPLKWARSVLNTLNSPANEVGKRIRTANPKKSVLEVVKDLKKQADSVSTGTLAGLTGAVSSMQTLYDRTSGDMSQILLGVDSMVSGAKETAAQFGALSTVIASRAENEKQLTASNKVAETLRAAFEKGDYRKIYDITEEELVQSEKTLGKNFVDTVRRLKSETDTNVIKRELAPLLMGRVAEASSEMDRRITAVRGAVDMFMDMTDRITSSPELTQRVIKLGELLRAGD